VDWETYFLGIADSVAARADCTRRRVGAVVVEPSTKHVIATGYNGTAPGQPGCLSAGACPRGKHYKSMNYGTLDYGYHCGGCSTTWKTVPWPCEFAVAPGSSYDTGSGACIAIHAEQNATIRAGVQCRGAWIYITDTPCDACMRFMKGAGYTKITWYGGSWTSEEPRNTLKPWTYMQAQGRNVKRWFSRSGKLTRS
jgi:dCMP deaminase